MKITKEIREKVTKHILATYDDARQVRIHRNGAVTVYGRYPNTNQHGRIFCSWINDVLSDIKKGE